jgi:3-dehydroquinate dehydratase-2
VRAAAVAAGHELAWHQTNHEGEFVDLVQHLPSLADGALVNAGAFTHTSLAIRDAFLAVRIPFVEVHLSNIFAREEARRHSMLADLAVGIVAGFGGRSYLLGLEALASHLQGRAR